MTQTTTTKPELNLVLCPACQHPKHVGTKCGYISTSPSEIAGVKVHECECGDAHARKADQGKAGGWHLLPWDMLELAADIYDYGSRKYKANSWQDVPPDPVTHASPRERFEQAMFRHWAQLKKGEWLDPESGKTHIAHFLWNAITVSWFVMKERGEAERQA